MEENIYKPFETENIQIQSGFEIYESYHNNFSNRIFKDAVFICK